MKKIFITGVTGYIGGAVAILFVKKGYEVIGLVRSVEGAEKVAALGITPVIGDLYDLKLIKEQAIQADAVVNTANADDSLVKTT